MSSCCLTQSGGRSHSSSNMQTTISPFPRGPFPKAPTTLTAALGVQAEKLGQAALLHHGRAAQVLLVKNPEEVIQLRQQLLQGWRQKAEDTLKAAAFSPKAPLRYTSDPIASHDGPSGLKGRHVG